MLIIKQSLLLFSLTFLFNMNVLAVEDDNFVENIDIIYIDEMNKVKQRLLDWVSNWSQGDYVTYLKFYVTNYAPRGVSHRQWKINRKQRVNKKKHIQINVLLEDILMNGEADRAETVFWQDYKSNNYRDKVRKKIIWVKSHSVWLIKQEMTLNGKLH
jgi:hypothetical protein